MKGNEEITYESLMRDFKLQTLISKADVLFYTYNIQEDIKAHAKEDNERSSAYYNIIDRMLDEFSKKVASVELIENIDDPWCYEVGFDDKSIKLYINYNELRGYFEKAVVYTKQNYFTLIEIQSKMLTVEEYAKLYSVGVGTVRQWIRRGKIRTAIKEGNEWRIPELTDKPGRGYTCATYEWNKELINIPDKYKYLNKYSGVELEQDENDRNVYYANYISKPDEETGLTEYVKEEVLNRQELETFELFLISNNEIEYRNSINRVLSEVLQKRQGFKNNDYNEEEIIAWLNRKK